MGKKSFWDRFRGSVLEGGQDMARKKEAVADTST